MRWPSTEPTTVTTGGTGSSTSPTRTFQPTGARLHRPSGTPARRSRSGWTCPVSTNWTRVALGCCSRSSVTPPRSAAYRRPSRRERPPGVHTGDGLSLAALFEDPGETEQIGGDAGRTLHPTRARRQQWIPVAEFDEAPEGVRAIIESATDEGVAEGEGEGEVSITAVALPLVQHDIAGARRSTAAAVVVPEAWIEPLGNPGDPQ